MKNPAKRGEEPCGVKRAYARRRRGHRSRRSAYINRTQRNEARRGAVRVERDYARRRRGHRSRRSAIDRIRGEEPCEWSGTTRGGGEGTEADGALIYDFAARSRASGAGLRAEEARAPKPTERLYMISRRGAVRVKREYARRREGAASTPERLNVK